MKLRNFLSVLATVTATAVQATHQHTAVNINQQPLNLKTHHPVLSENDASNFVVLQPLPPPPREVLEFSGDGLYRRDFIPDHEHTGEMDDFGCHNTDSFLYGNSAGKEHIPPQFDRLLTGM